MVKPVMVQNIYTHIRIHKHMHWACTHIIQTSPQAVYTESAENLQTRYTGRLSPQGGDWGDWLVTRGRLKGQTYFCKGGLCAPVVL